MPRRNSDRRVVFPRNARSTFPAPWEQNSCTFSRTTDPRERTVFISPRNPHRARNSQHQNRNHELPQLVERLHRQENSETAFACLEDFFSAIRGEFTLRPSDVRLLQIQVRNLINRNERLISLLERLLPGNNLRIQRCASDLGSIHNQSLF